jgi:signal transduction histidine kinase
MRRRSKTGGKPVKAQHRKTLKRRNVAKAVSRRSSSVAGQETRVSLLTRERDEALERQKATAEILASISGSMADTRPVFDAILRSLLRLFGTRFAVVLLVRDGNLELAGLKGDDPQFEKLAERYPVPLDNKTLPGKAILAGQALQLVPIIGNPKAPPATAHWAREFGYNALLSVPLVRQGKMIGALNTAHRDPVPFTDKQVALIKSFADQAVIAIENVRLFEAEQQRTAELTEALEQQTATSEVLKVISSSPGELEPVFQSMLENATRICEAKFGTLYRYDGKAFYHAAGSGTPAALIEKQKQQGCFVPNSGTLLHHVMRTQEVAHSADYAAESSLGLSAKFGGARSTVVVPLLKEDELLGAFAIYRQEVRPFTYKQIELVKSFAAQAVIAIENTRLLSELRQSLQQQTATADVLKVISRSTFDLQTVLDTLVKSAHELCGADRSFLFHYDGKTFTWGAGYGFSVEYKDFMLRELPNIRPGRGTLSGRVALDLAVVHIPDYLADTEATWFESQRLGQVRTMLGVPLLRGGILIGLIGLTCETVRPFTNAQIELVTTFADQAVIAIENVRLFESVEARTRELAKSLEDLQTAQDRLVQTEKLASLGQLTAGIAHEIKNPLNFVNNFSAVSVELIDELREALDGAPLDAKLRGQIEEIADMLQGNLDKVVQHGKRADSIVKNMLLHSRAGSGERRPVDINALVEESLNLAYHGARAEKQDFNIVLERCFDPAAGEVDLFPQEITRVLLNLISNGFYAATKRGAEAKGGDYEPTVTAATCDLGHSVEIRIRDNGSGIPPEVKERMFDPFFTTKPAGEGTGLGLSISHDIIVKQHNGSIEVDTQPGAFTEFRIVLPRGAGTAVKPATKLGENA